MQGMSDVWRTVDHEIHLGRQRIRDWAAEAFTKERIADVVMLLATVALFAVLLLFLQRAFQIQTAEGVSPYLSSFRWDPRMPGF